MAVIIGVDEVKMIMKKLRPFLWLSLLLLLAGCVIPIPTVQPLTKIDPTEEVQSVSLGDASRASVRLRLLSEEINVRSSSGIDFFRGVFKYNIAEWSPKIDQEFTGNTLKLTVGQGLGSQLPIGLDDEYDNAWDIELAKGIPMDVEVDMVTGKADLDLSGLFLTKLTLTTGTADVALAFHEPNPEPLSMLRVTAGTGKTTITGLGHANIDQLNIIGGTGTVNLDFNGMLSRSAIVDIKAGAGEFNIRVPDAIGARVTFIGTPISSMTTTGFTEEADNIYYNDAYGQAALTLTIKITAGVGKVTLISQ
jgi:hypothetical protein